MARVNEGCMSHHLLLRMATKSQVFQEEGLVYGFTQQLLHGIQSRWVMVV